MLAGDGVSGNVKAEFRPSGTGGSRSGRPLDPEVFKQHLSARYLTA
jgi:hypothetical protein